MLIYYKTINTKYMQKLQTNNFTPKQQIYCILSSIGKTKQQILKILNIPEPNYYIIKSKVEKATKLEK